MVAKNKKKISLVTQGGGQRGIFTAGVLDAFLENKFDPFSLYVGTSAGALNLSSYLSRQSNLAKEFIIDFSSQRNFFNLKEYIRGHNSLNLNWGISQIGRDGSLPLDFKKAHETLMNGRHALACLTESTSLSDEYFPLYRKNWKEVLIGTSSVPILCSQPIKIGAKHYFDGGVSAQVPIHKAWSLSSDTIIVIRTEPIALEKKIDIETIIKWKLQIMESLPNYWSKFKYRKTLEKFSDWQTNVRNKYLDYRAALKKKMSNVHHNIEHNPQLAWESADEGYFNLIVNEIKCEKTPTHAKLLDIMTKHYQNMVDTENFIHNPPKNVNILQIAPPKQLQSRVLMSKKEDLNSDYEMGYDTGLKFLNENFDELMSNNYVKF